MSCSFRSLGGGIDNLELDEDGALWFGAHAKLLTFVSHAKDAAIRAPSQVIRAWRDPQGIWQYEELFLSAGEDLSASSVAAPVGDRLLIGSVFEPHFLDCRLGSKP